MYPELERNNKDPDINCPVCSLGMDVFTEYNGDEIYTVVCLDCKSTFKVKQLIFKKFEVK